jgi:hypothetical protein
MRNPGAYADRPVHIVRTFPRIAASACGGPLTCVTLVLVLLGMLKVEPGHVDGR